MELLRAILTLIFTFGQFALGVAGFIIFMGMHNNTKDGNSFRLLNPLIIFMPDEFTEKGNKYRKAMLWFCLCAIIYGVAFNFASNIA